MVDIQSTTAEIRRGIKKEERRRKKETTGQKYNGLPYSIGQWPALFHRAATNRHQIPLIYTFINIL